MPLSPSEVEGKLKSWLEAANTHNFASLKSLAAPGATWTVIGPADRLPNVIGTRPVTEFIDRLEQFHGMMASFSLELKNSIVSAEGDRAVVELIGKGAGKPEAGGKVYNNQASIHFSLNDEGLITEVREYMNLFALFDFMGIPL